LENTIFGFLQPRSGVDQVHQSHAHVVLDHQMVREIDRQLRDIVRNVPDYRNTAHANAEPDRPIILHKLLLGGPLQLPTLCQKQKITLSIAFPLPRSNLSSYTTDDSFFYSSNQGIPTETPPRRQSQSYGTKQPPTNLPVSLRETKKYMISFRRQQSPHF
jgi:hypothetical protein